MDVLRSLIRSAAERAGGTLRRLGPVAKARQALREVMRQRAVVGEEELASAVAHAHGVRAASVAARDGAVRLDVTFDDGDRFAASLVPLGARFAPRGPKELLFRVEPGESARGPRAADVAAAVAGAVARGLWRGLLPEDEDGAPPTIVDRDDDVLRIDLRTLPAVRKLQAKGGLGVIIDVMEVRGITADHGELSIQLELPNVIGK